MNGELFPRNDSVEITRVSRHGKKLSRIIYKNYLFGFISWLKISIQVVKKKKNVYNKIF